MDACRTAVRKGCDTTVVYRKTFENMPANPVEVREAQEEGVRFETFAVPVSVRSEDGRTFAVVRSCENYTREDGRLATRILEGTDRELPFDSMIVAVSQSADRSLFGGTDPGRCRTSSRPAISPSVRKPSWKPSKARRTRPTASPPSCPRNRSRPSPSGRFVAFFLHYCVVFTTLHNRLTIAARCKVRNTPSASTSDPFSGAGSAIFPASPSAASGNSSTRIS